jgi:hypothetical protein
MIATDMADVVARVNQEQWALIEWTLMLADELYCTAFFCVKLYQLGWGWGEDKHVSHSFLGTLRRILLSALACFVIPSILLIALIVMQALRYRPDLEGYVFATFVPMTVISAAFCKYKGCCVVGWRKDLTINDIDVSALIDTHTYMRFCSHAVASHSFGSAATKDESCTWTRTHAA